MAAPGLPLPAATNRYKPIMPELLAFTSVLGQVPGFAPVAEVGAELFWRVGNCELVRGGFERFPFGEILSFSGNFAVWTSAHGSY